MMSEQDSPGRPPVADDQVPAGYVDVSKYLEEDDDSGLGSFVRRAVSEEKLARIRIPGNRDSYVDRFYSDGYLVRVQCGGGKSNFLYYLSRGRITKIADDCEAAISEGKVAEVRYKDPAGGTLAKLKGEQ